MAQLESMESLGRKYNTDKVTHHEYHRIFPLYLEKFRNTSGAMLEIGIHRGSSLQMWLAYFPLFHIYGLDIQASYQSDRVNIFMADQSKAEDLERVATQVKHPLIFINDDGSHIPEHQLLTFNKLFPLLEDGGVYIIEDVETSYWRRGRLFGYSTSYGIGHPKSIIEIFKEAADGVNHEMIGLIENPIWHLSRIHSISFSRNCIIVLKGGWQDRPYRYAQQL